MDFLPIQYEQFFTAITFCVFQRFISILPTVGLIVHKLLKLRKDDVCNYANVLRTICRGLSVGLPVGLSVALYFHSASLTSQFFVLFNPIRLERLA